MKQHHASRAVTAKLHGLLHARCAKCARCSVLVVHDERHSCIQVTLKGANCFFEWSFYQFIVFSSRVWCDVIRFIVIRSQCTSQGTSAFDSAEVRRKACHLFHHLMWKCVAKNNLWCYSMWVFGSWDIWCCYVSFFSDPLIAGVPWTSEYSHLDVRLLTEVLKSLLTNCFDCEVRPLYPFQRHNSPFLRKPKLRDGWTVLVTYVWGINGNIYLFD